MAEYIKRETLVEWLRNESDKYRMKDVAPVGWTLIGLINELHKIPAADVVPRENYESMEQTVFKLTEALAERKHGKWIPHETDFVAEIFCSNCHAFYWKYMDDYKFCPNCGADMRETCNKSDDDAVNASLVD